MAPRVPIESPYGDTRPLLTEPDNSGSRIAGEVAKGLGAVFGAGEKLIAQQQDVDAKAKKEANALVLADANLNLQLAVQEQVAEAKKTKGLNASEQRADRLKALQDKRKEIADSISDPQARADFLERSVAPVVSGSQAIESHVSNEFEAARGATLRARQDHALAFFESGEGTDEFNHLESDVVRDIRDNQLSEEQGTQAVADFQSRAAFARLKGLLARGDIDGAEAFLNREEAVNGAARRTNQETLGTRFDEAKTMVERARRGRDRDRRVADGLELVDAMVEKSRNEDGFVDERALRDGLDLSDLGDARDDAQRQLELRIRTEDGIKQDRIREQRKAVDLADLHNQPIPGATLAFLEKYDPGYLLARKRRQAADARAWMIARRGTGEQRRAAKAAQDDLDQRWRWYAERQLLLDPSRDVDEILTDFTNLVGDESGTDVSVSKDQVERARTRAVELTQRADAKDAKSDATIARRFESTLRRFMGGKLKKGQKVNESVLNERVGRALDWYRQELQKNGGKPLDEEALAGLEARMTSMTAKEEEGFFFNSTVQVPTIDLPSEPPKEAKGPADGETKTINGVEWVRRNGKWVAK
jgi:hypothetical protein